MQKRVGGGPLQGPPPSPSGALRGLEHAVPMGLVSHVVREDGVGDGRGDMNMSGLGELGADNARPSSLHGRHGRRGGRLFFEGRRSRRRAARGAPALTCGPPRLRSQTPCE